MRVSVIVPTYNRSGQILNLLRALEEQSFKDFETVIVNDGSTDNSLEKIAEFCSQTSLNIKVHTIENRGRARSRNYGVSQSEGDMIIFFDDDVRPNRDAVGLHHACHLRYDRALVTGPYLYDHSKFTNRFNHFRQWMELKWTSESDEIVTSENLRINGGNFSMKRSDFLAAGGFDERLNDKEDFKLSFDFRYKCQGNILYFYPTWVYHDDFRGLGAYIKRARSSRIEEQKLRELDPQIGVLFPERFIIELPKGMKYRMGRILRLKPVISLCEIMLDTRLIIRSIRFKIYDMIITMNVTYLYVILVWMGSPIFLLV